MNQTLVDANIKSRRIYFADSGLIKPGTIRVRSGRFSDLTNDSGSNATESIPAIELDDLIVTPGLIDLHTHLFSGQDLGLDPDANFLSQGVVGAVDAGSAGAHLYPALKSSVIDKSRLGIRAFLNIATVGTTSILLQGELKTPAYCNEEIAFEFTNANRDTIIGIKVRASNDVGGTFAIEGLEKARRVADRLSLPLMVHLGPAPADVEYILKLLGPGDILTHAYTGWSGNTLVIDGKPRPAFLSAKSRGVNFDIGHGMGGFDSTVAKILIDHGHAPTTISTDLHTYSQSVVISMPEVMSKFLALGLSLEEVLTRSITTPARISNLDEFGYGKFTNMNEINLAAFALEEGRVQFKDCHHHEFEGAFRLVPKLVISKGEVVVDVDGRLTT